MQNYRFAIMRATLAAQRNLAWIIVGAAVVTGFLIQDLFMLWPVTSALMHLGYRWGRLDQFDQDQLDAIKIS